MKLPFDFGIKLVFRLLMPGLFLTLGLLPVINAVLDFGGWESNFEYVFVFTVIFVGWLVSISDMPLYMLFEGRRFWPAPLWERFVHREESRIQRLQADLKAFQSEANDAALSEPRRKRAERKQLETYVKLRSYPVERGKEQKAGDQVDYVSRFPTRLGNILEAYESYPARMYGIASVFYWWRVWLTLDKDLREEIDNQQALVDSTIYTSFAFFFSGVLWFCYAVLAALNYLILNRVAVLKLPPFEATLFTHLPRWWVLPILSVLSILIGFLIYRTSLHLHVQFGEIFKSVYEMRRENIDPAKIAAGTLLAAQPNFASLPPRQKYKAVWNYLQYNLIECPGCETYVSAEKLDSPCARHNDTDQVAADPAKLTAQHETNVASRPADELSRDPADKN